MVLLVWEAGLVEERLLGTHMELLVALYKETMTIMIMGLGELLHLL